MSKIDAFPTHSQDGLEYCAGRVLPFGATVSDGCVNFSIYSKDAEGCSLLLYHYGEKEPFTEIAFLPEFRIGDVFCMMVFGINIETTEYGYRFYGKNDPQNGYWFDGNQPLLDPYARSVTGSAIWGKRKANYEHFPHRGQIINEDYDWDGDVPLNIPLNELVLYELHVRGFTRSESSGVRHKGTFAGLREKIPYLKELGINCIELMPIFAFDEYDFARMHNGEQLYNYWGYSTVCFFAPKAGYAASAPLGLEADELKGMIRLLHKNGIAVVLDVVFNHTAEGNENGPVISYRGIDNRTYYMLSPGGGYVNYSGCGNTFNCNHAVVRGCIMDCLRYWVSDYHVDGFRFDLASIMTRDENGAPMLSPPLIEHIARDAVLGRCILIAEAWDAGGLYQVGQFPSWNRWSEWNGRYRDCLRRFIKGGAEQAPELYLRISGSPDMYGERSSSASVNFITCHDGFTMYDLFAYNEKHNEANGEDNRDGCGNNDSWNCGAEGQTDDPEINALRMRQMKNAFTILLTSRGIPMLLSGDEFANTQSGNNNAYCHDNALSWLDWSMLEKNRDLFSYVRTLLHLRREHPVLRNKHFDTAHNGTGYPELSFHSETPWQHDPNAPALVFAYLYAEDSRKCGTAQDAFIYVLCNAHWETHRFTLPLLPEGLHWHTLLYSGDSSANDTPVGDDGFVLMPRSTAVLIAR